MNTCGYKSYYNPELNMATSVINDRQGALYSTEYNFDCALLGKGFFRVNLNDGGFGYTRNGQLKVGENSELLISNGYSLSEPVYLPESFIRETFMITLNHDIYVSDIEEDRIHIGRLETYNIPADLLEYYKDGIYKPRGNINEEKITMDNEICNKFVEGCNYNLLSVLLRMYYILFNLNDSSISNIEFKKEIVKYFIGKIINEKEKRYDAEYGIWHIETILPFLKYDY